MMLKISKAVDRCMSGHYGFYQRVYLNEAHDKCLLLEKIRLNNQAVLCVTCQVWHGTWYSYTPQLCNNANSIMVHCEDFIGNRRIKRK